MGSFSSNPTLTANELGALKRYAQTHGMYSTGCPAGLTGQVVYIDTPAGTLCKYQSNSVFNSAAATGVVVLPNGSLELAGGVLFYGLIYSANLSGSSGALVSVQGGATVHGGVIVDGPGTIDGGSNSINVIYDDNVYGHAIGYGSAAFVPGTRRRCAGATSPATAC